MSETPRLRSAFPLTPQSSAKGLAANAGSPTRLSKARNSHATPPIAGPAVLSSRLHSGQSLVPLTILDAPTQRLTLTLIYLLLLFWRLGNFYTLTIDETESLWLFMKWVSIDGIFLFGLPGLRIPWMEWSSTSTTVLFLLHAVFDAILMFRVNLPFSAFLVALGRVLWDRELAISEHRVKPQDILQNPSLILGRQIINILPEGSAVLNPDNIPICLDSSRSASVVLPLHINQTNPTSIEFIRFDFDSPRNETVTFTASQIKKLRRDAEKVRGNQHGLILKHTVRKTGLYRLGKVIDETKLEVQHAQSEALVVSCPSARIKPADRSRCRGDLSNIAIQVEGTPPLKVKYRRAVNGEERDVSFQSIQPDDFFSPLVARKEAGPLASLHSTDVSWARTAQISIPINETLARVGTWSFSIDQVTDATGNTVYYGTSDDDDNKRSTPKGLQVVDSFVVHDRPTAALTNFDSQHPVLVARGQTAAFPIKVGPNSIKGAEDLQYTISYLFTPVDQISVQGEHAPDAQVRQVREMSGRQDSLLSEPGLYTLQSVSSSHCDGDINEPSTFALINPAEPDLEISPDTIVDKCAKKAIGFSVDLKMSGTPPFNVHYIKKLKGHAQVQDIHKTFDGPRGHVEFRPEEAGHYIYQFQSISDGMYEAIDLNFKNLLLEHDVRPSVTAAFKSEPPKKELCIDDSLGVKVKLQGEQPWKLEYELVHGNKRTKHVIEDIKDIQESTYSIKTDILNSGGQYSLALLGITDKSECREALQQDLKFSVRRQKPKAAFGLDEGKRSIKTLESKLVEMPIRLSGEGPWDVTYKTPSGSIETRHMTNANDVLAASHPGTYEILAVKDDCPGFVDEKASSFHIDYIGRPQISIPESSLLTRQGALLERNAVCEGEEDAIELFFSGHPPFDIKFQEHVSPISGSRAIRNRALSAPLTSAQINLDTSQAGTFKYIFSELGDYNYDHDSRKHKPLTVQQSVYPRPSASFDSPGKVFSYCQGDESAADSETIPITLKGQAPFSIDIDIKHLGKSSRAQSASFPNIPSNKYLLQIPHRLLQPGFSHLSIRRVRDSRGCERLLDPAQIGSNDNRAVQISVHDPPTINTFSSTGEGEVNNHCVGDRLSFSLSGVAPFSVFYTFEGAARKASVSGATFRRMAELPGNFTITGVQDAASSCRTRTQITHLIHPLPSVKVSRGRESHVDIHAGGAAEITFDLGGTPPFEFTYTRSENAKNRGGKIGGVLETKRLVSETRSFSIRAGDEGTYEVVAVRDAYCAFARPGSEGLVGTGKGSNRLLEL